MPPIQDISDAEADERIARAMSADVPVAGGGLLHIERTRVGWTLDVDTGNGSDGRAVNTAAVSEIRRQIVLKNMGGLILIDLAGSKRTAYRRQWDQALRQVGNEMTTIYGWTRAGLYEIGRRRGRASLWDTQADTLPVCVYYRVRRALARCRSGRLVVHAACMPLLLSQLRFGRKAPCTQSLLLCLRRCFTRGAFVILNRKKQGILDFS